jgi:hypothetical protein
LHRDSGKQLLGIDMICALNQAAGIVAGRYVAEPNVVRQGAEERNSLSDEHRHASDNETLNEPFAQEPLDGDPAVDVEVMGATSCELRNDLCWRPRHLFHNAASGGGEVEGTTAKDNYALVTVGPRAKGENFLERLTTDHNCIDGCDELVVAVGFSAARRKKVEIVVRPRNEAIDAGADKN